MLLSMLCWVQKLNEAAEVWQPKLVVLHPCAAKMTVLTRSAYDSRGAFKRIVKLPISGLMYAGKPIGNRLG